MSIRICALLAQKQYGYFSRVQARRAGVSDRQLDRMISAGELHKVHAGIFRCVGAIESWLGNVMAACMWAGPGSFASHRSAAVLWELDGIEPGVVEISVQSGRRTRGVRTHRLRPSDRPPTRLIRGIRVTAVERTLLDLAGVVLPRLVGLALDDALRRRLTTLTRVWDVWERYGGRGRRGTTNLRRLLTARDDRDGFLATRFEKKMRRILRRIQPSKLVEQCRIRDGAKNYYLDFAYPHARLGIECHSIKWHMGEERFKRDLRRDRRLKLMGWTILYYSWDDVVFHPEKVEAEVRRALRNFSSLSTK